MAALEAAELLGEDAAVGAEAAGAEAVGAEASAAEEAELGEGTEGSSKWAKGKEFIFKSGKWILAGSLLEQFMSGNTAIGKGARIGVAVIGGLVLLTFLVKLRALVKSK